MEKTARNAIKIPQNAKKNTNTTRTFLVLLFWLVIALLFLGSYTNLLSKGESPTQRTILLHKKLITIEGIDIKLDGLEVASPHPNLQLEVSVTEGFLHTKGKSSKSVSLFGPAESINEQLATLVFKGTKSAVLTLAAFLPGQDNNLFTQTVPVEVESLYEAVQREVSLLIKTHERPKSLVNLVTSIRHFYPSIRILVADDSRKPIFKSNFSIDYYPLEYDLGLSASRNYLLDKTTTKYFMTLDDDFVFTNNTKIEKLFQVLLSTDVDLVSGSLYTDPVKPELYDYAGNIAIEGENFRLMRGDRGEVSPDYPACKRYDIVANFFMARTAKIRQVKWDPALKLGEHQDFFLRAKQEGVRVASCFSEVTVFHEQDHTNPEYKQKRGREIPYIRQFLTKHGLKNFYNYAGLKYVWVLE